MLTETDQRSGLVYDSAGDGGEGGEAGIDPAVAAKDPVAWGEALGVIGAHYLAGLHAYRTGETEAGAQMFAHGLSEVYSEMEDAFVQRGLGAVGEALNGAVEAASARAPDAEVAAKVNVVLDLIAQAVSKGPAGSADRSVRVKVMADMIDRAAAQLPHTGGTAAYEAYLDGMGFLLVARDMAGQLLPWLDSVSPRAAAEARTALDLAGKAFGADKPPATRAVEPADLMAAATRLRFSLSGVEGR